MEEKVKNKFKLVSILKLHNRITESQLRPIAKLLVEAVEINKSKKVHKALVNALEVLAAIGSKAEVVVNKSKALQWSAEQPVLEELFNIVTEPIDKIIENSSACNCDKCKERRSAIDFTSKEVLTESAAKDVSKAFNIKGAKVMEIDTSGKDIKDVINSIVTAIMKNSKNKLEEGK
jgi:hypothetical protein